MEDLDTVEKMNRLILEREKFDNSLTIEKVETENEGVRKIVKKKVVKEKVVKEKKQKKIVEEVEEEEIDFSKIPEEEINKYKENVLIYERIDHFIDEINKKITPFKDTIKPLTQQLTQLRKKKKEVELQIYDFMKKNRVQHCNLPNRKTEEEKCAITYGVRRASVNPNEEFVKERLINFFRENVRNNQFNDLTPEDKAEMVHKYIYENIPKKEVPVIKKTNYIEIE